MCKLNVGLLIFITALLSVALPAQADLKCGTDSQSLNNSGIDFAKDVPRQINSSAPVGTVLYRKEMELSLWCGKDLSKTSSWDTTPEEIVIRRENLANMLGSDSGLAIYITINGDRGTSAKIFRTGVETNIPWVSNSIDNSYLPRAVVNVTIELVKTGENKKLNVKSNTMKLFSVQSSLGTDTDLTYYLKNGRSNLDFTIQTCDINGSGNFTATIDTLNTSSIHSVGPIESPSRDFNVSIICNSDLWSTQSIVMKITGNNVAGMADQGLFHWKDLETGLNAENIALQLLQGADGSSYVPVVPGEKFVVGNFENRLSTVTIPLRARYYATGTTISAGEVQSVLFYNIDYE
ncbi:fimbrial protein [Intestinirhabdus alba]|uniref:Fimbrial-type adhesion domain-containing protein n=1 Tax=Intestinirhabdus alba TaxID=2899544 RepID=A0A6L6IHX1_9ENTR|nr:fimbrial protein [Intestinirhabdus alba]MTH45705.1 hypothetical protein [Intestinirhabdus alba]